MRAHIRPTREDGWWRWILSGPWQPKYADQIRRRGPLALELNEAWGFVGDNLDFLGDVPELLELQVIHHHLLDDRGVEHCSNLRSLDLNTYSDTSPDFSRFRQLESCSIEWRGAASSLLEVQTLHRLAIQNPPWPDLYPFQALAGLVSLTLGNARRLRSLAGAKSLRSLESLVVYLAPRLASLAGIEELGSLVNLELEDCRTVNSLEPAGDLRRIRSIHFTGRGMVDNLDPLQNLNNLEELWLGGTKVADGRLTPLLNLPALREVRFRNRPEYDISSEALTAELATRTR